MRLIAALGLLLACRTDEPPPTPPEPAVERAPEAEPAPVEPPPESEVRAEPPPPPPLRPPPAELTIVPGERVGPITPTTSRSDLAGHFPDDALRDTTVGLGEGFEAPGTVVHGDTDRAISVVWADPERTRVAELRNLGAAWRTAEGLGVGSTLAQLGEVLGEFQLFGFGWDHGGTVFLEGTEREAWQNHVFFRLAPVDEAAAGAGEPYQALLGDGLFPSSHPALEQIDVRVAQVMVRFGQVGR